MPAQHEESSTLLTAIDTLYTVGSTWHKTPEERATMTMACHDSDALPRVNDAGKSKVINGSRVQIMHNGLMVKQAGYQGKWEAEVIKRLRGIHEPQEEKVFHEVLKRLKPGSVMMELGSWWCYYSMWFLKTVKDSRAICCEPDPENMKLGEFNMEVNGFSKGKDVNFYAAASGSKEKETVVFMMEDGSQAEVEIRTVDGILDEQKLNRLDLLHMDIQGAELDTLRGAQESIKKKAIRFLFISTHHYAISGVPNMHQRCLDFIVRNEGFIIAQHSVYESCSGDGLIVASFDKRDKDFHVEISRQSTNDSLFRPPEEDLAVLWESHNGMLNQLNESRVELARTEARFKLEIDTKTSYIQQLETELNEITPLRRHIKRFVTYRLHATDRSLTRILTRKSKFKPKPINVELSGDMQTLLKLVQRTDYKNFTSYNKDLWQPILPIYSFFKKTLFKSLQGVRRAVRKRGNR